MSEIIPAAAAATSDTVTYQLDRDVLMRVWFRRMLFHKKRLRLIVLLAASTFLLLFFGGQQFLYLGGISALITFFIPFALARSLSKFIDNNPSLLAPKTIAFSPESIIITGPHFQSELAWSKFNGFTEDAIYFYLISGRDGLDTVIPKSAFTPAQQENFRRYATSAFASE